MDFNKLGSAVAWWLIGFFVMGFIAGAISFWVFVLWLLNRV